jgi:hypothetical protein
MREEVSMEELLVLDIYRLLFQEDNLLTLLSTDTSASTILQKQAIFDQAVDIVKKRLPYIIEMKRDEINKKFSVGDKVTYKSFGKSEKGIVKSTYTEDALDDEYCFVVYNCNNDWGDYRSYTSARTRKTDLTLGWEE